MKSGGPYLRFLKTSLRYWPKILLGTFLMTVFVILSGLSIGMLYPIAQKILIVQQDAVYEESPMMPQISKMLAGSLEELKDKGIEAFFSSLKSNLDEFLKNNSPMKVLQAVIFVSFIIFLLKSIVDYFHRLIFADIEQSVIKLYQEMIFNHYSTMSMDFFQKHRIGELTARITSDVSLVGFTALGALIEIARNVLLVLFYLVIALAINFQLTLIALVFIPIMSFMSRWMTKKIKKYMSRTQDTWAKVNSKVQEIGTNIKVVLSFGTFEREKKSFSALTGALKRNNFKRIGIDSLTRPLSDFINMAVVLFLIWIGGKMIIEQTSGFSPAAFFVYLGAVLSLMHPVKVVVQKRNELQGALVGLERIYSILDVRASIEDSPVSVEKIDFTDEISFDSVCFSYVEGKSVLKDLSFCIKKGETAAIVGRSGVGKTTILELLMRFYDPSSGTISIDGTDIRKIKISSLRKLIGSVSQEVLLFYDTVENNIAYAKEDAAPDDIEKASKIANADEFIKELPDGYKTIVGERGTHISGGQRQRIAIARAVLQNPKILLFDEATSSLDNESERKVQDSIDSLLKDRTAIIVAHRLTTVKNVRKIFVIEQGKLAESGTHEELYGKKGVYRQLYDSHELFES
ncbi:ABC transporter ATP-binding protein [candidate division WOR-3 bacterium]|nr:ABC transporter ATP-binding protein [candidate division WOR-3 bacterium]